MSGIKLSPGKCHLCKQSVSFLGHVVSKNGISTDPKKIEVLEKWEKPETVTKMRSFLGFANYYRRFVKNFASFTRPLEEMLKGIGDKKNAKLTWTKDGEGSFNGLKKMLLSSPTLSFPVKDGIFVLDTDACFDGIGAVLSQRIGLEEKVIAFGSRKMTSCETMYCITRKELLAVYYYVTYYKHYLLGKRFVIRTDHKALQWLMNWRQPNTAQYYRWIGELSVFDFHIEHRSGVHHTNADFLSRLHGECEQCPLELDNPRRKRNVKIIKILKEPLLLNQNELITKSFHDCLGHLGIQKTFNIMCDSYQWPDMRKIVEKIVAECQVCAERKVIATKKKQHIEVTADRPFEKIIIDIFGPVTKSRYGHRYALGIVDVYSRYPMIVPLRSTDSRTIVNALLSRWIAVFGSPETILSDGGANLSSHMVHEFCLHFGICKIESSAYHPQTNGKIERLFRTVKDMIYSFCKQEGTDWVDAIPHIEIGLRASIHNSTNFSPFYVLFGKKMSLPLAETQRNNGTHRYQIEYIRETNRIRKEVESQLKTVVREIQMSPAFSVGDLVMIRDSNETKGILRRRFFGPGRIEKVIGPKTFEIIWNGKMYRRNAAQLKSFRRQANLEPSEKTVASDTLNS